MKDDDDDDDDASSSCNTDDVRRVVADSASSLSLEQRRQALLQFYGATHANNNKIMQSSNPDNDNEESDNDDDDDTVDIVTQLLNTNRTKASTKPTRANPNANASSHPSSSLVPHSILDPESLAAAAAAAVWTTPTTTPATTTTPAGGTASLPANKSNTASAAISASSSSAVVAASPGPHRMRLEMAAEIHDTATVTVTTTATATNGGDGETRNPPLPSSSTAAAAAAGSSSSFLPEPVAVEDDSCVAAATTHPRRPPPSPNIPSQVHISTTPTTITTSNNNNNNTTAAAGSVASRTVAFDFSVNGDGRRLPPPPPHWIVPNNNNNRNSCISNTKNDAARQSVTPTPVDNTSTHKNCLGVVHVRLLRAQRLPCPVHSQVQAIVHLHPWKGKVRIAGRRAVPFLAAATSSGGGGGGGDSEYQNHASNNDDDDDSKDDNNDEEKRNDEQFHGVCVEWDDDTSSIVHNNNNNNADNVDLVDDEEMDPTNASSDPAATASMVHAYSDQDSPIPVIQIDLTFTTPILALLEFTMCSLQVPCDVLLQNPNVWRRQWFSTASTVESTTEQTPLIEIQAMFEPLTSSTTDVDDESSTSSESERITFDVEDASYHQIGSQHPSMPLQMQDKTGHQADGHVSELDDSIVDTPAPWSSIVEEQSLIGDPTATLSSSPLRKRRVLTAKKQHLLSIITFRGPACCCVCGKSVMSGPILLLIKKLALRCEACSIDCCDDCRLRVDIELPCGSAVAEQAVANAIQNKLTFDKLLNVIAPLDDTNRLLTTKTPATLDDDTKDRPPVDGLPPSTAPSNSGAAGSARTERGIGTLRMEFVRAHVWTETLPADTDPLSILNEHHIEARLLRPGDYYVRVTWSGSDKTVRTPTIQHSTGRPSLKSGEMRFVV